MQPSTISTNTSLQFKHLPGYAAFLLQECLHELTLYQLQVSRELQVPLLQQFEKLGADSLEQLAIEGNQKLLNFLARNEAQKQIEESLQMWVDNQLPQVDKYQIVAEDITLTSLVRKKAFLHFLPSYCRQMDDALAIISEIDQFITASETASTKTYITLLRNQIDEHSHFIQQVNNTIPGALYVFDLVNFKGIYSNGKLKEVVGFDDHSLNGMGASLYKELLHPDDLRVTQKNIMRIQTLKDGEINSYRFRIRQPDGQYRWVRIYESVFKRDEQGNILQTIAIALNVDKEKRTAEQLAQREQQLLEAQDIAQIGSYVWDYKHNTLEGTPKLFELLEISKNDIGVFVEKTHPDDMPRLKSAMEEALKTGKFECEFRYRCSRGESVFWSKAVVNFTEDGSPATLTGTLMDITERSRILEHLRQSEKSFKQAEALAHIGNFEIDLATNKVKMSDELFRIYELPVQKEPMDYNFTSGMRHPDDEALVQEAIRQTVEEKKSSDFYFRIVTKSGSSKILRTRAEPVTNGNGKVQKIVGTIQDVTEKQQLIEKL
ncbi:MAG: PAS domain-containing protein, partial [Chitinophagaceae bacterium]